MDWWDGEKELSVTRCGSVRQLFRLFISDENPSGCETIELQETDERNQWSLRGHVSSGSHVSSGPPRQDKIPLLFISCSLIADWCALILLLSTLSVVPVIDCGSFKARLIIRDALREKERVTSGQPL